MSLRWEAEAISLDGHPRIRLSHGPYLQGYFRTMPELVLFLKAHGVDLSEVHLVTP